MINRILIRIKVIQILYSFLLVEKQFAVESRPSAPTKEKRFAYSLYLDMLVLMIRIAERLERRPGDKPLLSTRFISRLLIDETVKSQLAKYKHEPFPYESVIPGLIDKLKESAIYKNYLKKKGADAGTDELLWRDIFNFIIMPDADVMAITSRRENHTLKGVERMHDMVVRTFHNFLASQDDVKEVQKALAKSLGEARNLYLRLLALPVDITEMQRRNLDENRYKFFKTEEDVNPDLRFVENGLVTALEGNEVLSTLIANEKINWTNEDPILVRALLKAILDSEVYAEYMADPRRREDGESEEAYETRMLHADCELWRNLLKKVILENPDFLQALEDKSVFWNDDLEIISTFAMKSFRKVEEKGGDASVVLDEYKDDEDRRFGSELISYLYTNKDLYRRYVNEALDTGRWDTERLAFMDIVILMTAIAEILNFPKIPLVASINEYIELAKSYSSARSGSFVNGVLGSVVSRLQKEGVLLKK